MARLGALASRKAGTWISNPKPSHGNWGFAFSGFLKGSFGAAALRGKIVGDILPME
jgi:hypothetical protein